MFAVKYPYTKLPLITFLTLTFTLLNVSLTADVRSFFRHRSSLSATDDTSGRSVPELWDLQGIQRVAMTPEESVHFRLDSEEGAIEWASALPRGKGVAFLHDSPTPFRLAVFHQLECLDVIRSAMHERRDHPSGPSTSREAHFCLNYLRQSIQCHADAHLEMVRSEYGGRAVLPYTTRTDCKDWERVWAESEANFDSWWEPREERLMI